MAIWFEEAGKTPELENPSAKIRRIVQERRAGLKDPGRRTASFSHCLANGPLLESATADGIGLIEAREAVGSIPEIPTITQDLRGFLQSSILADGVAVENDTQLSSLGVDSMSLVQMLLFVERTYGFAVPDEKLTKENLGTLSSMARCVRESGLEAAQ